MLYGRMRTAIGHFSSLTDDSTNPNIYYANFNFPNLIEIQKIVSSRKVGGDAEEETEGEEGCQRLMLFMISMIKKIIFREIPSSCWKLDRPHVILTSGANSLCVEEIN